MTINGLVTPTPVPLGLSTSQNTSPRKPHSLQLNQSLTKMALLKSMSISTSTSSLLSNLQLDYSNLERSYADLLVISKSLTHEKQQLEKELISKDEVINEQSMKINKFETIIKSFKDEDEKNQQLFEKELFYYKELVLDLEIKIKKLSDELKNMEDILEQQQQFKHLQILEINDISSKYKQLLIDFRVLQSNFEIEQNSKLVLMDQIELYEKERENYLISTTLNNQSKEGDQQHLEKYDELRNLNNYDSSREIHIDTFHTLNALHDQSSSDDDNDDHGFHNSDIGFVNGHSRMLSSLADEITSSSPIKYDTTTTADKKQNRVSSIQTTDNFKFPPSPTPALLHNSISSSMSSASASTSSTLPSKRQSLPVKLKTSPHLEQQDEFVLSPLKLIANHDYITSSSNHFDLAASSTERRYSTTNKPHHARYNSHDILPIKVEFEQQNSQPKDYIRSTSVPERIHSERESSSAVLRSSKRNSAFMALHGSPSPTDKDKEREVSGSNRNSLLTESSSKRSSIVMEQSLLTSDMTKQEIMKLKFELHSLKLHNEKLLSYIGFELQKQKKNIKRLSHKQSLNDMNKNDNKRGNDDDKKSMEYSDAKLIEKSKEMLIHKKRVLRSVSINPIISKRITSDIKRNSHILSAGLNSNQEYHQLFNGEEDEYGFLSKQEAEKFNSRFFDNEMKNYYELVGEEENFLDDFKGPKKFKSQVFRHSKFDSSSEDNEDEEDLDTDVENATTVYDLSSNEKVQDKTVEQVSEPPSSVFSSIKYLFVGNSKPETSKSIGSVDETIKYKFFLVAAGILIIGIRFSHQQH